MPVLASAPTPTDAATTVELTRLIRAPRARIYEAWTDPTLIKQWFGPPAMYCPNAALDVRVGGAIRLDAHPQPSASGDSAGHPGYATGVYTQVVPDELLQFSWAPSWLPGEESLVTISLKDADGGTEIALRHERFIPTSNVQGYERGWIACLQNLAALLQGA